MIKRNKKLAFIKFDEMGSDVYARLEGFTQFSVSTNPKEYSRKYIDEDFERSEVAGYSPSISYKFDYDTNIDMHNLFLSVSEPETTGEAAKFTFAIVDLSKEEDGMYLAKIRDFNVIPQSEGDDPDAYTYSGIMKAAGPCSFAYVSSEDDWKTMKVVEECVG